MAEIQIHLLREEGLSNKKWDLSSSQILEFILFVFAPKIDLHEEISLSIWYNSIFENCLYRKLVLGLLKSEYKVNLTIKKNIEILVRLTDTKGLANTIYKTHACYIASLNY